MNVGNKKNNTTRYRKCSRLLLWKTPDNLNILVKWFGLNIAGGESGPLVLVFAVPSMEEGTFYATQLSLHSDLSRSGARTAKNTYGVQSGWVAHGFTDNRLGCGMIGESLRWYYVPCSLQRTANIFASISLPVLFLPAPTFRTHSCVQRLLYHTRLLYQVINSP